MNLWNVGGKVSDLSAENEFLIAAGARVRGLEKILVNGNEGQALYAEVGDTRVLLFESVDFESTLGRPLALGWSHIVFEVDDFQSAFDRLVGAGGRLVQGPAIVEASFGRRRIAFVESPGGCIYEVFQALPRESELVE
jgi:catechol 2,3-dioxygenase-like lactoylglutathione lyase family enzyme